MKPPALAGVSAAGAQSRPQAAAFISPVQRGELAAPAWASAQRSLPLPSGKGSEGPQVRAADERLAKPCRSPVAQRCRRP